MPLQRLWRSLAADGGAGEGTGGGEQWFFGRLSPPTSPQFALLRK